MPIAKKIEIIAVPHGTAPAQIRAAWVGCRFPCEPECGHIYMYVEDVLQEPRKGLLKATEYLANPEKYAPKQIAGFSVDQRAALDVLEKRDPKAARWWREHGFPQPERAFRFKREHCAVVDVHSHPA